MHNFVGRKERKRRLLSVFGNKLCVLSWSKKERWELNLVWLKWIVGISQSHKMIIRSGAGGDTIKKIDRD